MSWILVRAEFEPALADYSPIIETFREFNVDNTLEDEGGLQGCLVDLEGSSGHAEQLRDALMEMGAVRVSISPYVEQDWEIAWRQFFKPRRVGQHFLIVPSWEEVPSEELDVVLILDPGQAFGTGDHPTTRMCLELLEPVLAPKKRLADVGCGSGILGIAAAKMGAVVLASDIDPVALEVARDNANRNEVTLELFCGDGLTKLDLESARSGIGAVPQDDVPLSNIGQSEPAVLPDGREFDIVVSNIISATLIRLVHQLTQGLTPGGWWIASGIIEANWPDVERAAREAGMRLEKRLVEDGWVAGAFTKVSLAHQD